VTRKRTTNRFWLHFALVAMVFAIVVLTLSRARFLGVVWLVVAAVSRARLRAG
jgi:hypothetical protein